MANKSYIHIVGIVGVVVFSLVLALSVGAVFFAGNETAYAFNGVTEKSLVIPASLLKCYNHGSVTSVGFNQLIIDNTNSVNHTDFYYFIYFMDIVSYFSDTVNMLSATPFAYKINFSVHAIGSGTIYFVGPMSVIGSSWARLNATTATNTNREVYGVDLGFVFTSSDLDTASDSWVDINSITLYYYDNDPLFDSAYDMGFEEGHDFGYSTGFADGEDTGWNEGYEEGFDSGVLDGFSDGYEQGFDEGLSSGYDSGYDDGYLEGIATAQDIINWSNSIALDISSVTPYVDEVDNLHGYSVVNSVLPSTGQPAIQVSRTAPPMLPACQISLGYTVPAATVIEFRWESLEPRGLASSGSYINFGALDQYGMYHYLLSSSTDSNNLGFTVSLPTDTQYIVVSTSQSVEYMYLVGFSYRIAGRTLYDIGLNVGYETGFIDGVASIPVENIKNTAYYEGFDDGVQSANEYTFTGLIGAVIDAPIKAFRGLFGFDVLGTNLANLVLSLFTLSIVLVVVKFIVKSS